MAGIAGILNLDKKPIDENMLKNMIMQISHRGAERVNQTVLYHIGMAHCQFHTTEESYREIQPLSIRGSNIWIVCDGRVDNRDELISLLKKDKTPQFSPTDAELILLSYEKWNIECLKKIVGDFAFSIWDAKTETLLCARDFMGIRPFYYTKFKNTLIWGSSIRQIFQEPSFPMKINDNYILDYLLYCAVGPLSTPTTVFEDILRLPPAHYIKVDRHGVSDPIAYWDPREVSEVRYQKTEDYQERLRELFREAVRCRLRCMKPVVSDLSGGLDSSSIVSMAQEIYNQGEIPSNGFTTCSMVFDDFPESDERYFQRQVVDKYQIKNTIEIPSDDFFLFQNQLQHAPLTDEPSGGFSAYDQVLRTVSAVYRFGARVWLRGDGGDAILQGNPLYLADLLRKGRFKELTRELKMWSYARNQTYLHALINFAIKPLVPEFWQTILSPILHVKPEYWHYFDSFGGPVMVDWVNPDFAKKMGARKRLRELLPDRHFPVQSMRIEYRSLYEDTGYCWMDEYVASPQSIEIRMPYYDKRLLEYMLGVPMGLKTYIEVPSGRRHRKVIMREALKDILPEEVRTRRRGPDFGRPALRGLQQELPRLIEKGQTRGFETVRRGYLDHDKFTRSLSHWMQGNWTHLGNLLNALSIELWLDRMHRKYGI